MKIKLIESIDKNLINNLYQIAQWGYLSYLVSALEGSNINEVTNRLKQKKWFALAKLIESTYRMLSYLDLEWLRELAHLIDYYRKYDIQVTEKRFRELIAELTQ